MNLKFYKAKSPKRLRVWRARTRDGLAHAMRGKPPARILRGKGVAASAESHVRKARPCYICTRRPWSGPCDENSAVWRPAANARFWKIFRLTEVSAQGCSPHPLVQVIDNCHNTDDGARQRGDMLAKADLDRYTSNEVRLQQLAACVSTEAPHTLLESGLAKRRMSILQVLQIESHQLAPQLRHHRRWRQTQSRPQRAWFDRRRQPDKADDSLLFPHPCNESFFQNWRSEKTAVGTLGTESASLAAGWVPNPRRMRGVNNMAAESISKSQTKVAESITWSRSRFRGVDFFASQASGVDF